MVEHKTPLTVKNLIENTLGDTYHSALINHALEKNELRDLPEANLGALGYSSSIRERLRSYVAGAQLLVELLLPSEEAEKFIKSFTQSWLPEDIHRCYKVDKNIFQFKFAELVEALADQLGTSLKQAEHDLIEAEKYAVWEGKQYQTQTDHTTYQRPPLVTIRKISSPSKLTLGTWNIHKFTQEETTEENRRKKIEEKLKEINKSIPYQALLVRENSVYYLYYYDDPTTIHGSLLKRKSRPLKRKVITENVTFLDAVSQKTLTDITHEIDNNTLVSVSVPQKNADLYQIQLENPISALTQEQCEEYLKIFDATLPKWFSSLKKWEQIYLQRKFFPIWSCKDNHGNNPYLTRTRKGDFSLNKEGIEAVNRIVTVLPSTLKKLPGISNFSQETTILAEKDENGMLHPVDRFVQYRSAAMHPDGIKNDKETADYLVAQNVQQLIEATTPSSFVPASKQRHILYVALMTGSKKAVSFLQNFGNKTGIIHVKDQQSTYMSAKNTSIYNTNSHVKFTHSYRPINKARNWLSSETATAESISFTHEELDKLYKEETARPSDDVKLNIAKEAFEDHANLLQILQSDERPSFGHHKTLFLASLEMLIVERQGDVVYSTCMSGKDRRALLSMHVNAMLQYYHLYGQLPKWNDQGDLRYIFVQLFVNEFISKHHQYFSSQNAPGCTAIKELMGALPSDMKAPIKTALVDLGYGMSDKEDTEKLTDAEEHQNFIAKLNSPTYETTAPPSNVFSKPTFKERIAQWIKANPWKFRILAMLGILFLMTPLIIFLPKILIGVSVIGLGIKGLTLLPIIGAKIASLPSFAQTVLFLLSYVLSLPLVSVCLTGTIKLTQKIASVCMNATIKLTQKIASVCVATTIKLIQKISHFIQKKPEKTFEIKQQKLELLKQANAQIKPEQDWDTPNVIATLPELAKSVRRTCFNPTSTMSYVSQELAKVESAKDLNNINKTKIKIYAEKYQPRINYFTQNETPSSKKEILVEMHHYTEGYVFKVFSRQGAAPSLPLTDWIDAPIKKTTNSKGETSYVGKMNHNQAKFIVDKLSKTSNHYSLFGKKVHIIEKPDQPAPDKVLHVFSYQQKNNS